jgi:hypothetical protein
LRLYTITSLAVFFFFCSNPPLKKMIIREQNRLENRKIRRGRRHTHSFRPFRWCRRFYHLVGWMYDGECQASRCILAFYAQLRTPRLPEKICNITLAFCFQCPLLRFAFKTDKVILFDFKNAAPYVKLAHLTTLAYCHPHLSHGVA